MCTPIQSNTNLTPQNRQNAYKMMESITEQAVSAKVHNLLDQGQMIRVQDKKENSPIDINGDGVNDWVQIRKHPGGIRCPHGDYIFEVQDGKNPDKLIVSGDYDLKNGKLVSSPDSLRFGNQGADAQFFTDEKLQEFLKL